MGRRGGKSSSRGVVGGSSIEGLLLKLRGTGQLLSSVIEYGRLTNMGGVVMKIGCLAVVADADVVVEIVAAKFNLKGLPRLMGFTTGAATSKGDCCCCVAVVVLVAVVVVLQILIDDDIVVVVVEGAADAVVDITVVAVEDCLLLDTGGCDPFKNSASI